MHRLHSRAGFTLIEIMVVVFILGLLATLVTVKILNRIDEAKRTKAAADISAIGEALHLFKLDNGAYPSTAEGLESLMHPPAKLAKSAPAEGYLEKLQVDPWGNAYAYFSDGQEYLIKSYGGDGQEGGEGKNADIESRNS
jgi:general secretion pathway protein G